MRYRSRTDIAQAILEACQTPINQTQIMFQAYVSHKQLLEEYIPILVTNGYISKDPKTRLWSITRKGQAFLSKMYDVANGLKVIPKGKTLANIKVKQ